MPRLSNSTPPPIEVYGLGTLQKIRDDFYYLEQCVEKSVHAQHRLEDETHALCQSVEELTEVVGNILDELKKQNEYLVDRKRVK